MSPGEAPPSALFTDATSNRAADCWPYATHAVSTIKPVAIQIL
jgi:hypothetical protein